MLLFIARHAWAGHYGDPDWPDDSLRELTPQGAQRYREMVTKLADRGLAPHHIATSPYARCLQTAWILAEETLADPKVEQLSALEPGCNFEALIRWSEQYPEEDICWVGHNPDVERLVAFLIGSPDAHIRFAKGAIAALRFESFDDLRNGECELVWHVTAKSLGI